MEFITDDEALFWAGVSAKIQRSSQTTPSSFLRSGYGLSRTESGDDVRTIFVLLAMSALIKCDDRDRVGLSSTWLTVTMNPATPAPLLCPPFDLRSLRKHFHVESLLRLCCCLKNSWRSCTTFHCEIFSSLSLSLSYFLSRWMKVISMRKNSSTCQLHKMSFLCLTTCCWWRKSNIFGSHCS